MTRHRQGGWLHNDKEQGRSRDLPCSLSTPWPPSTPAPHQRCVAPPRLCLVEATADRLSLASSSPCPSPRPCFSLSPRPSSSGRGRRGPQEEEVDEATGDHEEEGVDEAAGDHEREEVDETAGPPEEEEVDGAARDGKEEEVD